jgi:hypothetical protein
MATEDPDTSFGERLRKFRVAAELTQEELVEPAGPSPRGFFRTSTEARDRARAWLLCGA